MRATLLGASLVGGGGGGVGDAAHGFWLGAYTYTDDGGATRAVVDGVRISPAEGGGGDPARVDPVKSWHPGDARRRP